MRGTFDIIKTELKQLRRDKAFVFLMALLFLLMTLAAWNTNRQISAKSAELAKQEVLVQEGDARLAAEIDSLNQGLASYADSYTLPSNGVRLTYNNHRLTSLPIEAYAIIAIGQSDIYSNYNKIVLYFKESFQMRSEELISPIEQLFGQLDLSFVWVYLLPLFIILVSFNTLSIERESGRLPLIASQPLKILNWLITKIGIRLTTIFLLLGGFTVLLLIIFQVPVFQNLEGLFKLALVLFVYSAFWFAISILVNMMGYSSGKNLIVLSSIWVLLVFLIPSVINQIGDELHPIPSRLEVVNHHQKMYNEMEGNFEAGFENLFKIHPDWYSDDPVVRDMSNSTGWNINYLAKEYIAHIKHQPMADAYEEKIDTKNAWFGEVRLFSPAMIMQESLTDLAGTSTKHYRSFLRQSQEYAKRYREYVYQGLFTNYQFTSDDIKNLKRFTFDANRVEATYTTNVIALTTYLIILVFGITLLTRRSIEVK